METATASVPGARGAGGVERGTAHASLRPSGVWPGAATRRPSSQGKLSVSDAISCSSSRAHGAPVTAIQALSQNSVPLPRPHHPNSGHISG